MGIKTLDERKKLTLLEHPLFILQVLEKEYQECTCGGEVEFDWWKSERIFIDDEEARNHARRHRMGRENYEWRVWAVPATGVLQNRIV